MPPEGKDVARFLKNKRFLEAAAGILAVESYHAGIVRTLLSGPGMFQAANAISNLRASVGGGKDHGIRRYEKRGSGRHALGRSVSVTA